MTPNKEELSAIEEVAQSIVSDLEDQQKLCVSDLALPTRNWAEREQEVKRSLLARPDDAEARAEDPAEVLEKIRTWAETEDDYSYRQSMNRCAEILREALQKARVAAFNLKAETSAYLSANY